MKTVMRKKRLLIINVVAACILLLALLWQNTSLACWDTVEWECFDGCRNYTQVSDLVIGNGWGCDCRSGSEYSKCDEEEIGICTTTYRCSQLDCEGTCVYLHSVEKYRCLVEW